MSGPKCIELEPDSRLLEREQNRAYCESIFSEIHRLEADWRCLAQRFDDFGLKAVVTPPVLRKNWETACRNLLTSSRDREAANECEKAVAAWRAANKAGNARLEQATLEFHLRFQQLQRQRNGLIHTREQLFASVKASTLSHWSPDILDKIQRLLDKTLQEAAVPILEKLELSKAGITALESAERDILIAINALKIGQSSLYEFLEKAHNEAISLALTQYSPSSLTKSDWLNESEPASSATKNSPQIQEKLDALLSTIGILAQSSVWLDIFQECEQVKVENNPERQQILFGNLAIKCSQEINRHRAVVRRRERISALIDEAAAWPVLEVQAITKELDTFLKLEETHEIHEIEMRLREAIHHEKNRRMAAARREAVLESLHELGYEVMEGLTTATVDHGRLIFQRDVADDYAVEVISNDDPALIQTSLIRFAESTDESQQQRLRDREREEAWCTEHAALRQKLTSRGWTLKMKVAVPAGQKAIKVVKGSAQQKRRSQRTRKEALREREK